MYDRRGRAIGFRLLQARRSGLTAAPARLAVAVGRGLVRRVACDRACSSRAWREAIAEAGTEPVVPVNWAHPAESCDPTAHRRRHRVERTWREWRAVATRSEKTEESDLGVLYLAAPIDGIKQSLC